MPFADEEFVSQVAKHMADIPVRTILRTPPEVFTEIIEGVAKKKGYIDGPRLRRYLETPEGMTLYMDRVRLEREALKLPKFEALTNEERNRVINEFKKIMGRAPTLAEREELYSEELKLKGGVLV